MVNVEVVEALAVGAISFLAGFATGQLVNFHKTKEGRIMPGLTNTVSSWPWFKLFIAAIFLFATSFLVDFTHDQRNCNEEFRRTIAERADATRAEAEAKAELNTAIYNMVNGLVAIPPETPLLERSQIQKSLFQNFLAGRDKELQLTAEAKKILEDNPYPDCGGVTNQ